MSCEKIKPLMMDFLYEELGNDDKRRLQEHLDSCAECAKELAALQETHQMLAAMPEPAAGERLVFQTEPAGRVREWLQTAKALLPRSSAGRLALTGLAALFAFFLFGAMAHLNIVYDHNGLQISMGRANALDEQRLVQIVEQLQEENARLITRLIAGERMRQQQELDKTLTAFARSISEQRREDLQLIGLGLDAVREQTDQRFAQTDDYLRSLVKQVYLNANQ